LINSDEHTGCKNILFYFYWFLNKLYKFRRVKGDMIEVYKFFNNIYDSATTE